jgi:hypothetical protein
VSLCECVCVSVCVNFEVVKNPANSVEISMFAVEICVSYRVREVSI